MKCARRRAAAADTPSPCGPACASVLRTACTPAQKLYQAFLDAKRAAAPKLSALGAHHAARLRALAAQGIELPRAVRHLGDLEGDAEKAYHAFFDRLRGNTKLVAPPWDGQFSGPNWIGYSMATPVSDGEYIYVKFATGTVACFDMQSKRRWMVHTPYVAGGITICSSPVLADGKVVIAMAANPAGSTTLWAGNVDDNIRLIAAASAEDKAAAQWREGLEMCRPYFEKVIMLKPACEAATRAKTMLDQLGR